MRCPRCSTPPPFDPFLCTTCGEQLLTYLDEPFGPGSGVGARAVGTTAEPRTGGIARGRLPPGAVGGPVPEGFAGWQVSQPVRARRPDNTGPFLLKLLFGLFVALILAVQELIGGTLLLVALAIGLRRWPRARLVPFGLAIVGIAAAIWVVVAIVDELNTPPRPSPTPTPNRAATSTAIAISGTPTLAPAARTATATVVAGENRARLSRARARWLRGDYAAARAELDDALAAMPGQPASYNLRALVRISAGDLEGAAADAERAVELQPANTSFRDTRAYAWLKLGRYDGAEGDYDRVLTGPGTESHVAAYLGRGIARRAQGKLPDARTDLETGLRLLPDSDPDPQLADLEIAARRALDAMAPRPGSPSPAASPAASPVALRAESPGSAREPSL